MATNFPSSLDSLSNPTGTDKQDIISHSSQHTNANDAIEALQAKVGINSSTDPSSLDYKVAQLNPLTTKGDIIVRSATANTRLPVGTDGQMLVADSTNPLGVKYTNPSAGGTVTTASVVSANGFTGSVANPSTTPAITLGTNVTGMVKGNGTALSSATQGTDYYAPSGTDVSVSDGGTGVSSMTAYGVVIGGTTSTGPLQSVSPGSIGQVLTSNGTANPTFQNPTLSIIGVDNQAHSDSNHTGFGSAVYSATIPANTITTGRGIKITGKYSSASFGFGDYKDDTAMQVYLGGVSVIPNLLLTPRNIASTFYGSFEIIISGLSSSSQQNSATNIRSGGGAYTTQSVQRQSTTIDTSVSNTIEIKFGFEYANAGVNATLETITIEKI